jgi:succinyl-diaminopimelate desuccinylase
MISEQQKHAVLARIEDARDEIVEVSRGLIRIPTTNPPGEAYPEAARYLDRLLRDQRYESHILPAAGRPEHSAAHPRHNVLARPAESRTGPTLHLNGHFDVVPAGDGWSVDPWGAELRDGRIWGRGAADMKCGLVAAIFAAEALRRSGLALAGSIEISGTVDEESGGFAGVAWLAHNGWIDRARTEWVVIPEPFGPQRICVGHRGVYWLKVVAEGRIAHGSMPFLGSNAIEHMGPVLEELRRNLQPRLDERRTDMPVVPPEARRATLNANAIWGGQGQADPQTPCVADRCELVLDRRFLEEEPLESVREELTAVLATAAARDPARRYHIEDLMVVEPVRTPDDSPLVTAFETAIEAVTTEPAERVASPGTYDHKHIARIAGIEHCIAYGPGSLELAHQPDEYCEVADLVTSTQVIALAAIELLSGH